MKSEVLPALDLRLGLQQLQTVMSLALHHLKQALCFPKGDRGLISKVITT